MLEMFVVHVLPQM